jgi:hypothetical protein
MTRDEHMALCKKRALAYLDDGDAKSAVASMLSDLDKHDETRQVGQAMGNLGLLYLMNGDDLGVRRWIEGFR